MVDTPQTIRIKPDQTERYERLEEAGSGGMGTVYRAREVETGEIVALKVLQTSGGDLTRFALEARILAKLSHPSIVGYRHHGVTKDGHPYLAMEWIDGQNLEERLASGTLSVDETLRIARAVADALAAAHEAGIIHRDLKPTNILLTRDTQAVKLADFGIARSTEVEGVTLTGVTVGTPGYMAPEQARGAEVDARCDLFSLGCVIFRCLGGRRPFQGSDLVQFVTSLALEDAPPLREIAAATPVSVDSLVARLLQKDPASRPESARHVRQAIDRILNEADATNPASTVLVPELSSPELLHTTRSPTGPTQRTPPRSRGRTFAAIALGLVAGGTVLAFLRAPHRTVEATTDAPAAAPVPSARPADDRSALDQACRDWSGVLAQGQRPDGSFSGEARTDPTGWDTAQQLFALTRARRACSGGSLANIASGVRALDVLHGAGGLAGPTRPGRARRSATPANAWALLALVGANRASPDPATTKAIARARADVLAGRNGDGGFRYEPMTPGASTAYATVLATWALAEPQDDADADVVRRSAEWLQQQVLGQSLGTQEPGFTEQLGWVTSRVNVGAKLEDTRRALARELIAHCRPDAAGACSKPSHETGRLDIDGDGGRIVTFWHPWATLASRELAGRTTALDASTTHVLDAISRSGAGQAGPLGRAARRGAGIQAGGVFDRGLGAAPRAEHRRSSLTRVPARPVQYSRVPRRTPCRQRRRQARRRRSPRRRSPRRRSPRREAARRRSPRRSA